MKKIDAMVLILGIVTLAACDGVSEDLTNLGTPNQQDGRDTLVGNQNNNPAPVAALDQRLSLLLSDQNIVGDASRGLDLPSIDDPLSQLGMKLFYSKSLGGDFDSACVTCHHPALGGTDRLSLGVGVEAIEPDVLGPARRHISGEFPVPRNAPTTFNSGLYRDSLFWDSRVAQVGGGIRTPDSEFGLADANAGDSLLVAQARFPVTSVEEMRTDHFETGNSNASVRQHLAARIGGYDGGFGAANELDINNWAIEFQTAFGTSESAESLINYDNIARALASYEASQVFIDSPWKRYVDGDTAAISDNAKRGAVLFFTPKENGGGDCSRCHQGDLFSDESHHVVAFPQIGPGKGDGSNGDDDFGLERETGNPNDRYKFRTPSLLNVAMTAPYGHTGAYATLRDVVEHYDQPQDAIRFFNNNNWCRSISSSTQNLQCDTRFPNAEANTRNAQRALADQPNNDSIQGINLNRNEITQIVDFLEALTDPCVEDRNCLARWIPAATGGPDGNQLNGVRGDGSPW